MIWEVFRQERRGQAFQHAGSVVAPDHAFAEIYAREQYGRRGESEALWLVEGLYARSLSAAEVWSVIEQHRGIRPEVRRLAIEMARRSVTSEFRPHRDELDAWFKEAEAA